MKRDDVPEQILTKVDQVMHDMEVCQRAVATGDRTLGEVRVLFELIQNGLAELDFLLTREYGPSGLRFNTDHLSELVERPLTEAQEQEVQDALADMERSVRAMFDE